MHASRDGLTAFVCDFRDEERCGNGGAEDDCERGGGVCSEDVE